MCTDEETLHQIFRSIARWSWKEKSIATCSREKASHHLESFTQDFLPGNSSDDIWISLFWQKCLWLKYWVLQGMSLEKWGERKKSLIVLLGCKNFPRLSYYACECMNLRVARLSCCDIRLNSLHVHVCRHWYCVGT